MLIADHLNVAILGIEDEDRAHSLVGDVNLALGIHGNTKRTQKLKGNIELLFGLGLGAGEAVHPLLFLLWLAPFL